jgi:hypothetical protein
LDNKNTHLTSTPPIGTPLFPSNNNPLPRWTHNRLVREVAYFLRDAADWFEANPKRVYYFCSVPYPVYAWLRVAQIAASGAVIKARDWNKPEVPPEHCIVRLVVKRAPSHTVSDELHPTTLECVPLVGVPSELLSADNDEAGAFLWSRAERIHSGFKLRN